LLQRCKVDLQLHQQHNIKSISLLLRTISIFLWPVKDDPGLKTLEVYRICFECGQIYTGKTVQLKPESNSTIWQIHLDHPDKSAMEGHSISLGHHIQFQNTSILSAKSRYMDCNIKEAYETEHHPKDMNRKMVSA
jgi:hypothetical protein